MDDNVSLRVDQIADLAYYIANPKCLNLSEPGTGKTPSVVVRQYQRWVSMDMGTAWIMPKSLLHKNRKEILRFTHFTEDDVVIVDTADKLRGGAKVFLMTFARFRMSYKELPDYVKAVDVDEFHKGFKSPESATCLALFDGFDSGRFIEFIPMTGTLVSGRLDSAYAAIRVVEPRYYGSYKSFLYQHAIYDYNDKIIGWRNHGKLSEIFRRHGIRRLFKDIHGEQEQVWTTEVVEMTERQRRMYDEFHEKAILELDKFFLDGTEPGVAFIRARQLMEHPNEFPDLTSPGEFVDVMKGERPAKESLLDIHIEDAASHDKPLIIFSALKPQQRRVLKMLQDLGLPCALINGDTSLKERNRIDEEFQAGTLKYLIVSPACADVGYNWQFCGTHEVDHVIFMTTDYLDTTILQAVQRAIRGARSIPLRVTFFEYADSMDQHILSIAYQKSLDAHRVDPTRRVLQLSKYEDKELEMT